MGREAADVDFVDDAIFERDDKRRFVAPVEGLPAKEAASVRAASGAHCAAKVVLVFSPFAAVGEGDARWIDQNQFGIVPVERRAFWSIDAPAIAKDDGQSADADVPVIAGAVF